MKLLIDPTARTVFLPAFFLLSCLLPVACSRTPAETANARRYELKGQIVNFNKAQRQVIIKHEAVDGLMEGMTMPFTLKDDDAFDALRPGADIHATLVVDGSRSWIEHPTISAVVPDVANMSPSSSASGPSRNDAERTGKLPTPLAIVTEPALGTEVPDVPLTNQDGQRIHLGGYKGRMLLLTFIYTRCPLPDYCLLMSENFAAVSRLLEQTPEVQQQTRLLSLTLDPAFDTPQKLREYGTTRGGQTGRDAFSRWDFATGDPDRIRETAHFFGLTYDQQNGQIVHSLRTALISPEGKLVKLYRGNQWQPAEVVRDLQALRAGKSIPAE